MSKAFEIVNNGMSLAGFFRRYPDNQAAEAQFEVWRWPDGPECPHCGGTNIATVISRKPNPHGRGGEGDERSPPDVERLHRGTAAGPRRGAVLVEEERPEVLLTQFPDIEGPVG